VPPDPTTSAPLSRESLDQQLAAAVASYRTHDNIGLLIDEVRALARAAGNAELQAAVVPYRDMAEVMIPVYETIVARDGANAQAIVVLANAYWLTGRGSDVVGELADRARMVDPDNRGAWHLWALAQPDVRQRMDRWQQVAERFPADQLARAALADNATSVASAEHDPLALDLAIATYEGLLAEATQESQRLALQETLTTLRGWSL
jgi:hypothetical protein